MSSFVINGRERNINTSYFLIDFFETKLVASTCHCIKISPLLKVLDLTTVTAGLFSALCIDFTYKLTAHVMLQDYKSAG